MRRFFMLLAVLVSLLALAACGGGSGVTNPDTPTPGTDKDVQLAQTTIDESTIKQDVISRLNTIQSNKSIHLSLSKIAKAAAPSDVYFVIAKVDSTVTGNIGTINYNFAYSENNDASTLVEGVITYSFEWQQENGNYHWVKTDVNAVKQPAKKLGTVKGKVINGITGLPVSGVRVYAEGKSNGKASVSALTDDNGQYQINGIVEGDSEVQAYVEQFEVASSGTVQVQGGQVANVADLKLLPQVDGYKVLMKGKVIDGDGNNATGVKVELSGAINETTLTDAGGNYTFGMVAAGSYKLLVTKRYKEGFETKQVDVVVTDAEIKAGNNKVIDTIYLTNKAPVVDIVQPAGGSISVNTGDVVTMKLNVTDADSPLTSMKYDWQFPVNAVVPVDMSQGNVIEWPAPNAAGTYEVKVVVYDEKGGVAQKKISVTVKNTNVPPVINLTATASGLTATLSGSVTDSDGTVSSVGINWGDSATGSVTSGFGSVSVSHTYSVAGSYNIDITATDNSGLSSSKRLTVTPNTPSSIIYDYNGAVQQFVVPASVTSINIECWGAQGSGTYGGKGGYSKATFSVTPNQALYIYVGGKNGYNGGGTGKYSGGGATDVRTVSGDLNSRIIVAGGGGGGADNPNNIIFTYAGNGGGANMNGTRAASSYGGYGGTLTAGGAADTIYDEVPGKPGVLS